MTVLSENELDVVYSAMASAAELVDVIPSREAVMPVLNAYGDALAHSVLAFRVATADRHVGELDCRARMQPNDLDPYEIAITNSLLTRWEHPVHQLFDEIRNNCPIDSNAIDFGAVRGFKKIWPFFVQDQMQEVSKLAALPSMPRSVSDNVGLFHRHGLHGNVGLVGIDYEHRTINLYFVELPREFYEPESLRRVNHDAGLPEPSPQMLAHCRAAFGVYVTLNWTDSTIERISYPVMTSDPHSLPVKLEPMIERFVDSVPIGSEDRRFIYAASSSAPGEYYKLQSFYRPIGLESWT